MNTSSPMTWTVASDSVAFSARRWRVRFDCYECRDLGDGQSTTGCRSCHRTGPDGRRQS